MISYTLADLDTIVHEEYAEDPSVEGRHVSAADDLLAWLRQRENLTALAPAPVRPRGAIDMGMPGNTEEIEELIARDEED